MTDRSEDRIPGSLTERGFDKGNNLSTLRIIFAYAVIISHSYPILQGDNTNEIFIKLFGSLTLGEFAVDGFFVISGYLIFKSYQQSSSLIEFLKKRCLRIYPGFLVCCIACVFLLAPIVGGSLSKTNWPRSIFDCLILLVPKIPGSFEANAFADLNGSAWTIFYEFKCYLLVPIVASFASKKSKFCVFLTTLLVLYAVRSKLPDVPHGTIIFGQTKEMLRLALVFFIGSSFYIWRDSIIYNNKIAAISAACLILFMFFPAVAEVAVSVFGGYLIFWYAFCCPSDGVSRFFNKVDPSYGIYLYAWPIQSLIAYLYRDLTPWQLTLAATPIVMVAGLLSWICVERPMLFKDKTRSMLLRSSSV